MVVLFAPQHTRESLTLHIAKIVSHGHWAYSPVEVISFGQSLVHNVIEQLFIKVAVVGLLGNPETDDGALSGRDTIALVECIPGGTLGSCLVGVDSLLIAFADVLVEGVLDVLGLVLGAPEILVVGVVFREDELGVDILCAATVVGRG